MGLERRYWSLTTRRREIVSARMDARRARNTDDDERLLRNSIRLLRKINAVIEKARLRGEEIGPT